MHIIALVDGSFKREFSQMLGTNKLSASVTHNLSGFIMLAFRRHDEAGRVVTGDKEDAI